MQNIDAVSPTVKTIICPEILTIQAFDNSGHFAAVEINMTPRWRQACGIPTFSQLVELALDHGAEYRPPLHLEGGGYVPGGYGIRLATLEMAALADPERGTFLNINGSVMECVHSGGRA